MKINSNKIGFLAYILMAFLVLTACQSQQKKSDKLRVVSSFSIISEMAKEVGKDSVVVHNLVPIGTDPHEYNPIPEDLKKASEADVFLYNGLNLEGGERGWFFKLLSSAAADKNKVFKVTEEVKPLYLSHKKNKEINPHAFINPKVGIQMVKAIGEAFAKVDPDNATYYQENAAAYIEELTEIEKKYRAQFSSIPEERKIFMASEQAFQYLTTEYGFKEGYIWAIDTEENGSPDQIKSAIAFVKEYQPPVLFVESNVDVRPMQTVSNETGVPIYSPAIYSDELGKPGQDADTYIKYLKHNLQNIYKGLTE